MMVCSSLAAWFYRILDCMGGCFGCCSKSNPITAVDEPTNGLKIQGQSVQKPSMYEDYWWSTSTCDIDISAIQSQRSFSSLSASNLMLGSNGIRSEQFEFINHGVRLWNQSRNQWVGSSKHANPSQQIRERTLSWNATYESLLGTSRPFSRPVPLSEMAGSWLTCGSKKGCMIDMTEAIGYLPCQIDILGAQCSRFSCIELLSLQKTEAERRFCFLIVMSKIFVGHGCVRACQKSVVIFLVQCIRGIFYRNVTQCKTTWLLNFI